jgi:hypothetical protein
VRFLANLVCVLSLVVCLFNAQYLASQSTPTALEADARNDDPFGRRRHVSVHGEIDLKEATPYHWVTKNKNSVTVTVGMLAPIRPIAPAKLTNSMVFVDVRRKLHGYSEAAAQRALEEAARELEALKQRPSRVYTGLMGGMARKLTETTQKMRIPAVKDRYHLVDGTKPFSPKYQLIPAAILALWLVFVLVVLPQYSGNTSDPDPRQEGDPGWEPQFSKSNSKFGFVILFFIGSALLGLATVVGSLNEPGQDSEGVMLGVSLLLGAMGVFLIYLGVATSSGEVVVAKNGVLVRHAFTGVLKVMPWVDAEWVTHHSWYYKGVLNHAFTFGRRNGTKLLVSVVNQDGETVRNLSTNALHDSLLNEYQRRLTSGETLDMGNLKLDRQSIQVKGWFSWITIDPANVEMVTTTGDSIKFTTRSGSGSGGSVAYGKLRNAFIVPKLLSQVIRPLSPDAKLDWVG